MSADARQRGLLLVGHGTRSPTGTDEFRTLAALVARATGSDPVEPAFLELAEPTICQGLARLVERGARQVIVVPLLLFAAGHAKRDIPAAAQAAARELNATDLRIQQADHLGCSASILELSCQRFTQSLQGRPAVHSQRTCLLLVGRGSHDQSATAQMHHFAALRVQQTPLGGSEVAFLAMAQPTAAAVLSQLAAEGWQRVVVQPHLLFHGELFDELTRLVRTIAAASTHQEWVIAPYLGAGLGSGGPADDLLTRAVLQRFGAAAIHVVASGRDG